MIFFHKPEKSTIGAELEFFILDDEGKISFDSDSLIRRSNSEINIKKECAKNMIEINTDPKPTLSSFIEELSKKLRLLVEISEKENIKLFYFGTYPGIFEPMMRTDRTYRVKEKIFGQETWRIAGRCIGFHSHCNLPEKIFNKKQKFINLLLDFKINQNIIDVHNLFIAMDPVLSTFMQSSPFYQGKKYGKDSRIMFYRGNELFGVKGLYTNFQQFGALPSYKHIISDVSYWSEDVFHSWSSMMKNAGIKLRAFTLYGSLFETNWSPLRFNPHGTFELRGMDMNSFYLIPSIAFIISGILKSIQKENLNVIINDTAKEEPFKLEEGKIYIPPFDYVNEVLQKKSAFNGMKDKRVRKYCKSFLKFIKSITGSGSRKFLKNFEQIISRKETVSDKIISIAKKMGVNERIDNKKAAELSLKLTEKIWKDIDMFETFI